MTSSARRCPSFSASSGDIAFDMVLEMTMPRTSSSSEYCGTMFMVFDPAANFANAAIASLSSAERSGFQKPPTFGTPPEMVQGIIAGGAPALTSAQEGAEDKLDAARIDLEARGVRAGDFVVGIAASGTTPYVRVALEHAKSLGARTAIVACSPPPANVLAAADIAIVAITGPEVVTGSTRLKAGTATKLILNMITTGAMIRLGKTFGNLMVDLRATNAKLTDRSERIIAEVCDVDRERARALLAEAGGRVKLAIVMNALGASCDAPRLTAHATPAATMSAIARRSGSSMLAALDA